jgi:hypothetical protein
MSLFDSLVKGATEQLLGSTDTKNNNLLGAAAKLINNPEVGGLAGLAKLFA